MGPACECPSNPNIANCDDVSAGELCEGDGECGTDNSLNNCDGGNVLYDVYRKQPLLACADGLSLSPVPACECPSNADIANCDDVSAGELCEGDGECGTDNGLDNCGGGVYDVYRKQPLLACADGLSLSPVPACECPSN